MGYQSINPNTGQLLKQFENLSPAQLEAALAAAEACFQTRNHKHEVVALANDCDFGLGGSVWTRDEARGKRIASRIDTGMVFVNNLDWADADLPFGGVKLSGYGRELGQMGLQEFVNKKLVRTASLKAPS